VIQFQTAVLLRVVATPFPSACGAICLSKTSHKPHKLLQERHLPIAPSDDAAPDGGAWLGHGETINISALTDFALLIGDFALNPF